MKKSQEFSLLVGMANIGFTENQATLSGPNVQAAASGSVAVIASQLHYRFMATGRKAYYGQFTFPLMASAGTYMSGGGGLEYYWGKAPSRLVMSDLTTSFTLSPITRYFVMGGINMGYISYLTPTAQKNDTILELELGGGLSRRFNKWTLRATAGVARGVGVVTTTIGMKAMVGGIFFLD
ncbi:MAG TPA: hypothetical protein VNJ08_02220 [Bacteriovoracaceae bacterium]|nr:hypothetical protein [Bacteriovoracaceae bacterium]